jgi:hypothetical protein
VAPSDWAMCHPVIHPYHTVIVQSCTVNMHSQLPCHRRTTQSPVQSAAMSHSYNPVTLPCHIRTTQSPCHVIIHTTQSPCHVSFRTTHCHLYCHVSACHWATSCMDCHVSSVQCHVSNPYWCQLSPKMPNLSDTCHLLVMPCQHDDIIMTSC